MPVFYLLLAFPRGVATPLQWWRQPIGLLDGHFALWREHRQRAISDRQSWSSSPGSRYGHRDKTPDQGRHRSYPPHGAGMAVTVRGNSAFVTFDRIEGA